MSTAQLNQTQSSKGLTIGLWIAQGLIAAMFLFAGAMKTFTSIDQLPPEMTWAREMPLLLRFIGISELAGALGLILPSALRIKPVLTPIAAIGIAVIMVLAAIYHGMHAEYSSIIGNIVFLAIALFIAWGRLKKAPIEAK